MVCTSLRLAIGLCLRRWSRSWRSRALVWKFCQLISHILPTFQD
ncbi:hypothetical protein NC651_026601 [Populus alba x Populus x berolinensis]|nr:hypothetical protein NC651_026601 [Populus alba x Populus x berolinensis]